jgi:5-hydroxyisourate hydrolase-like protein (transthyretin family)
MDLCVGVRVYIKGRIKAVSSVKTDEDGRFEFQLGRGRSRHIWFVHRFDSGAAATNLLVRVRAPVALGASRHEFHNGQAVKLRGRMLAAARSGLLVELQALRGNQWQTFATTRTRKGGRFDYRYRFTRTFGVQRYALRARIAAQVGSAFATGASRPVSLVVKG